MNEAVYIAKDISDGHWTATGAQFQIPYVFKTLFSKEPIEFKDVCETKSVKTALYLDFNENLPNVEEWEKKYDKLQKLVKSGETDPEIDIQINECLEKIEKGHDYHFVGKAGSFCPVINGVGGGYLMREKDGKYSFAGGTKGYRWMEAEVLKALGTDEAMRRINKRYYAALVDDAIATISEYGDFEAFASN